MEVQIDSKEDTYEIVKLQCWNFLQNQFHKAFLGKHIESQCPYTKGDNNIIEEIDLPSLQFSSSEPMGQFQPNLANSILGWRALKVLPIRTSPLKRNNVMIYFIALRTCVDWFELVSQVSVEAHGPLVYTSNLFYKMKR